LQTHKQRCETALPGTRVAVNLAGVHHSEVARGDVLALPGVLRPTTLLDMRLRVLGDAPAPLKQNTALDLFLGAAEVRCRLTLLDAEALAPGSSGWAQLRLERPVVAMRGDRGILRVASPSRTVAGGVVVDPYPPRHRRFRPEVIAGLEARLRGDPLELLLQALGDGPPRPWAEVRAETGLLDRGSLAPLMAAGQVLWLGAPPEQPDVVDDGWLVSAVGWAQLEARLLSALREYHRRYPLRRGMPREEARQKLRLPARALGAVLDEAARRGLVALDETRVWLAGHDPRPSPEQLEAIEAALAAMRRAPYAPPTPALDEELLAWTLERGLIVRLAADVFLLPETYAELLAWVRATALAEGSVSVGMLRDRFGSSRKYAVAFLEHLDERKITRREGESRVLV
ncbi:MAG: SelB C-terminal domain-containing protein, partial [Chloroflexaceae bacterium]|nr:SelB C-terminal domain-containing protein [Chloroflexaceae bacterium]